MVRKSNPERFLGLVIDETASYSNSNHLDKLRGHCDTAIERVQGHIYGDLRRTRKYKVPLPLSHVYKPKEPRTHTVADLSLFKDCGIPIVNRYGTFIDAFTTNDVQKEQVPLVGLSDDTAHSFLNYGILKRVWWVNNSYAHVNSLMRLRRTDDEWQSTQAQAWFDSFADSLGGYLRALFVGKFIDRNGNQVTFLSASDLQSLAKMDLAQMSPQLAGSIVTCLAEFLGDECFQVPYYSASILAAYRAYSAATATVAGLAAVNGMLQTDIAAGSISDKLAKALNLNLNQYPTPSSQLDWTPFKGPDKEPQPTIVASDITRVLNGALSERDGALLTGLRQKAATADVVSAIKAGTSPLQDAFTCKHIGVIGDYMNSYFIPGSGSTDIGGDGDYADLVGQLTAFGGVAAQKGVRALFGGLIRGVSIAALGNEVLAEVLSAGVSTLAKKVIEAVVYNVLHDYINDSSIDSADKKALLGDLAKLYQIVKGTA